MNKVLAFRQQPVRPDIGDQLEVFLATNLDTIVSPHPEVLLTPQFKASLDSALNSVGIRHNIGLQSDLKDIIDVFIIVNASVIV